MPNDPRNDPRNDEPVATTGDGQILSGPDAGTTVPVEDDPKAKPAKKDDKK